MTIIIIISVMAFLIAAIISIILIVSKARKNNEYIPFGPFIVLACFVAMAVPTDVLLPILFKIFTFGMYRG